MLELDYTLDKAHIPPDVATELKCQLELRPTAELTARADGPAMTTNICLVFDCSGSMAGAKAEAAIEAAHLIVNTIDERHRISLVGFATSHWVLVDNARPAETGRELIRAQIERLRTLIRGSTNLAEGIRRGINVLHHQQADARVIVVLSDGEADSREEAVKAGREATDKGIQVFAVGIGEDFKADDLLDVVMPSNGAVLGERDVDKLNTAFGVLLGRIESFVATDVRLTVSLHQGVHPGAAYKTSPERAFIGTLSPVDRTIRLHVGNIERGQRYAFLLALTPPTGASGPVEIGRATLHYDVPSLRLRDQRTDVAITVVYDKRARDANPGVVQAHRRAELAELVDALADAERAVDVAKSTQLLDLLRRRSEDDGNPALARELRGVTPPIPQAKLNALVLAATARASHAEPPPAPLPPPPPAPRRPPAPLPPPPVREQQLYDVVLVDAGDSMIELLREIREHTGLGLAKVHELVKQVPATLVVGLTKSDATTLKQQLEAAGARVELEKHAVPSRADGH